MIFPALSAGWRSKSIPACSGCIWRSKPPLNPPGYQAPGSVWSSGARGSPLLPENSWIWQDGQGGSMFLFSDGSISCFTPPIRKPLIYTPILKAEGFLWSVWKSGCATTAAPGELSVLFSALVVWLFSFIIVNLMYNQTLWPNSRCCCWDRFSPLFSWCYWLFFFLPEPAAEITAFWKNMSSIERWFTASTFFRLQPYPCSWENDRTCHRFCFL